MQPHYAVLTGDFIGSAETGATALQSSMHEVASIAFEINHWPGNRDTRFTRSRGDGWQLVLYQPGDCLRAALMLQARLRAVPEAIPTRISIGVGPAESLGTTDLSDASGAAFTASGQGLDQMYRLQRLAIRCGRLTPFLQSLVTLSDEVARRWTREQAEAICLALQPGNPTLAEMAEELAISKQAVNYRLTGASLRALRLALRSWEDGFDLQLVEGV